MAGIDFIRRIIREAVRLPIESLRPPQARIDPAHLGPILEQLHPELRMLELKLRQAPETI